jgi:hypothetical protein
MIHDQCLFPPNGLPLGNGSTYEVRVASKLHELLQCAPVMVSVLRVISPLARTLVAPDFPGHP